MIPHELRPSLVHLALVVSCLSLLFACGDDGGTDPPDPNVLVYEIDGAWECTLPENCQDVYDLEVQADTYFEIELTNVTGTSVPRLALYAPSVDLGGLNLLTESTSDRRCAGQDQNDSVEMTVDAAGIYRLAVGRDGGRSGGGSGTYHLKISAGKTFVVTGQSVDNVNSLASDAECVTRRYTTSGAWSCPRMTSCEDIYEIEFNGGELLEVLVSNVTGESYSTVGLYAPGVDTDGDNLLTGANLAHMCGGEEGDQDINFTIPAPGRYKLTVGRMGGITFSDSGSYELSLRSSHMFEAFGRSNDDATSQFFWPVCFGRTVSDFTLHADWDCAFSVDCQDVYEVFIPRPSQFQIIVSNVTGNSAARLAIYAPNEPLGGINLITGTAAELSCLVQDDGMGWQLGLQSGLHKVAITRDWGASGGGYGTYRVSMQTLEVNPFVDITVMSQSVQDGPSLATGTWCPPQPE